MKKLTLYAIILLSISMLTVACRKTEDMFPETDKLSTDITLNGEVAVPLVNTELLIFNFAPKETEKLWLEADDNNLIHMKMLSRNVFRAKIKNILTDETFPMPQGHTMEGDDSELNGDTTKLQMYDKMITGKLEFQDPRIIFHIRNQVPFGLFCDVTNISMYDADEQLMSSTAHSSELAVKAATAPGDTAKTDLILTKEQIPSLPTLLSNIPKYISYKAKVGTKAQDAPYEIKGNEKVEIDVEVDIPFIARMENITLEDTLDFVDLKKEDQEEIKSVTLKLKFNNGYPLNTISQIYLVEEKPDGTVGEKVDSLFTDTKLKDITEQGWIFPPAEIDAQGVVTKPTETFLKINIDRARLDKLKDKNAKKMIIKAVLNTHDAQGQSTFVKILSTYTLGVKIAIKAELESEIN